MFVEAQTTLYIDQTYRLNNSYKYHSRKIIQHLIFLNIPNIVNEVNLKFYLELGIFTSVKVPLQIVMVNKNK